MIDWQPIETAPRDGTWFLAWWPAKAQQDQIRCTQWRDDGWGACFVDSNGYADWASPTHWMPLPNPPKQG